MKIGILALQGDVIEHLNATKKAVERLKLNKKTVKKENKEIEVMEVREKKDFRGLTALIIPGGESTTLTKLLERENLIQEIKKIKNILGTCAGAVLLSKSHLNLMDIEVERNAYGSQLDSFEKNIQTKFGERKGIFIRAPKITKIGEKVKVIAKDKEEIVGVEQKENSTFYIALTFHPELENSKFHEYFLENCE